MLHSDLHILEECCFKYSRDPKLLFVPDEFDKNIKDSINKFPADFCSPSKSSKDKHLLYRILSISSLSIETKCAMIKIIIDNVVLLENCNPNILKASFILSDIVTYFFFTFLKMNVNVIEAFDNCLSLAKHVLDRGLDLNNIHFEINSHTSLMCLCLFGPSVNSDSKYDLRYTIIKYAISTKQIDMAHFNQDGETFLTLLAKFSVNDVTFRIFQRLMGSICCARSTIYESDLHYKVVLSAIKTTLYGPSDIDSGCRIVELLYETYPYCNRDVDDLISTLYDETTSFDKNSDCVFSHRQNLLKKILVEHLKVIQSKNITRCERLKLENYRRTYHLFKERSLWLIS